MADKVQQLRDFINQQLGIWKIPGAGVVVVQGDEVLLCEGFGQRNLEQDLLATEKTLFAIGSCTKAFTTLALGMLVEEGKLDWDQPLRKVMPAFRLFDAVASERATARDLVSHRMGLPRHDLLWYSSDLPRKEIFERLQYLEPNKDFRAEYQYQNLMFMTAGYLVEYLTGKTWEEFVRERIFTPLGMTHSNFSVADSQTAPDFAIPYQEKKGQVERMEFRNIDNMGPAGSINSCAQDMLPWLRLHLNGGKADGQPLISPGNLSQMHSPQTIIHSSLRWKELLHPSYGLGWIIDPYRGYHQVQHGGNIDGFSAMAAFLPQEKIGVVALANQESSSLPSIITYRVFDLLLGLEPAPWSERFMKDHDEFEKAEDTSKAQSSEQRKAGHPPAHALEEYAGEYENPGYGILRVVFEGDHLKAVYNNLDFSVEPYHYDIFEFYHKPQDMRLKVSFQTDEKGSVSSLSAPLESSVKDIVFTRLPERGMKSRAFLEPLTGTYILMDMEWVVALKGDDQLVATLPGQPAMQLEPYEGLTFNIKGFNGASITFKRDENGQISEAEVTQPGIVLSAKRREQAFSI
jgi:CubicO group peptidase (beta-lactamase class C family)